MTDNLSALAWPAERLGEAIEALARRNGLSPRAGQIPTVPRDAAHGSEALGDWIEAAACWFGFEAEPTATSYGAVEQMVRRAGPALLRIPGGAFSRFLALLPGKGSAASLLAPDFRVVRVPTEFVRTVLVSEMEAPLTKEVDRLVEETGIEERHRDQVRGALLRERLNTRPVGTCWLLRLSPGSSFWRQARQMGLPQRLLMLVAAYGVEYFLWILSWWLVGRGALEGHFDRGWLLAWALLLLTIVPFRLLGRWLQGVLSIGAGILLKQRLLYGALHLQPEEIRHQGAGQFLGQVIESEAVESLALSGGFLVVVAGVELIAAAIVLAWGAAGALHLVLLLTWLVLTLGIAWSYLGRRQSWTRTRLRMTDDLVERMVGHRTRLTQEAPEHWHEGEDEALERYLEASASMDRSAVLLMALVPSGWLILGFLGLVPAFAGRTSQVELAIALGGILLGYRALRRLASGLWNLADAIIAWKQVAALFHAASRPEVVGLPTFALPTATVGDSVHKGKLVEAHDLVFHYKDRSEPVLGGCNLSVQPSDRLLLEGPSGGGKSTLASLLTGLRPLQSGLLLLNGLDRQTLGDEGWRRRVVSAPQFHENHVLTETFAFNLLMGRRWPPREDDMREAEAVCRELGLSELLERMPAGLLQTVGETGWQLSHGERSRLFIARALLQGADMIILDESFAALDPETLKHSLNCVLRRAPTLMVIAHP
jgi:ATP-binding cassette subfamily B protein